MEYIEQLLGVNLGPTGSLIVALGIVLLLIILVAYIIKRLSGRHGPAERRGRVPRLAIMEIIPVDQRRRLILLRRDNIEHLVMIGGPNDTVIEAAIDRTQRGDQRSLSGQQSTPYPQRAPRQETLPPKPAQSIAAPTQSGQPPIVQPVMPQAAAPKPQPAPMPVQPQPTPVSVQPPNQRQQTTARPMSEGATVLTPTQQSSSQNVGANTATAASTASTASAASQLSPASTQASSNQMGPLPRPTITPSPAPQPAAPKVETTSTLRTPEPAPRAPVITASTSSENTSSLNSPVVAPVLTEPPKPVQSTPQVRSDNPSTTSDTQSTPTIATPVSKPRVVVPASTQPVSATQNKVEPSVQPSNPQVNISSVQAQSEPVTNPSSASAIPASGSSAPSVETEQKTSGQQSNAIQTPPPARSLNDDQKEDVSQVKTSTATPETDAKTVSDTEVKETSSDVPESTKEAQALNQNSNQSNSSTNTNEPPIIKTAPEATTVSKPKVEDATDVQLAEMAERLEAALKFPKSPPSGNSST